MKVRNAIYVIVLISMLMPAVHTLPQVKADTRAADEPHYITFYFHRNGTLDPFSPTSSTPDSEFEYMEGETQAFEQDLEVAYAEDAVEIIIWASAIGSGRAEVKLYDGDQQMSSKQINVSSAVPSEYTTVLYSGSYLYSTGSRLRVSITLENVNLFYDNTNRRSRVIVHCIPVLNIQHDTYDMDGTPAEYFYPHQWPESKLMIKGQATSALQDNFLRRVEVSVFRNSQLTHEGNTTMQGDQFSYTWDYSSKNLEDGEYSYKVRIYDIQDNTYDETGTFNMVGYGVLLTSPEQDDEGEGPAKKSASPDTEVDIPVRVRNIGGNDDTYSLTLGGVDRARATLTPEIVTVEAGEYSSPSLKMSTMGKSPGDKLYINLTAEGTSATARLQIITLVSEYGVQLSLFSQDNQTVVIGETVRYKMDIRNTGIRQETVNLQVLDLPSGWDADIDRYTISALSPGQITTANVTVSPPNQLDNTLVTESFTIKAEVDQDENIYDKLIITVTGSKPFTVLLDGASSKEIAPESKEWFRVYITNLGSEDSGFLASISGITSEQWRIEYNPDDYVWIEEGRERSVSFGIMPSLEVLAQEYTPQIRITKEGTAMVETIDLRVTVSDVHDVIIDFNQTSFNMKPGGKVSIKIAVENKGNVPEDINFNMESSSKIYDWIDFSDWTLYLPPGKEEVVEMTIEVPDDAALDDYSIPLTIKTADQNLFTGTVIISVDMDSSELMSSALGAVAVPLVMLAIIIVITYLTWKKMQELELE